MHEDQSNATWVFAAAPAPLLNFARTAIDRKTSKQPTLGEGRIPDRTYFDAQTGRRAYPA